jgi:hypothetical protein
VTGRRGGADLPYRPDGGFSAIAVCQARSGTGGGRPYCSPASPPLVAEDQGADGRAARWHRVARPPSTLAPYPVLTTSQVPEEVTNMPVLPLRDVVVYPHMVIPLFVGREKSIQALEQAMKADKRSCWSRRSRPTSTIRRPTTSTDRHGRDDPAAAEAPGRHGQGAGRGRAAAPHPIRSIPVVLRPRSPLPADSDQ